MSTPTQTPQTDDQSLHHTRLDDIEGVVISPVRPTTSRPAVLLALGALALALVLYFGAQLHIAAAAVLAFVVYLFAVNVIYRVIGGPRVAADQTVRALVYFAFVCAVLPLISVLWTVIAEGAGRLLRLTPA